MSMLAAPTPATLGKSPTARSSGRSGRSTLILTATVPAEGEPRASAVGSPITRGRGRQLLRSWAAARGLRASETAYVRWTKGQRPPLRFSKSGNARIEKAYRTHWVSRQLSVEKHERSKKRKKRPAPELGADGLPRNGE